MQCDADPFGVVEREEPLVRALVAFERFRETILAMQNVGDVYLETRASALVSERGENGLRAFRGVQCLRVSPHQQVRLDRRAERTAEFDEIAAALEQPGSLLKDIDGRLELIAEPA